MPAPPFWEERTHIGIFLIQVNHSGHRPPLAACFAQHHGRIADADLSSRPMTSSGRLIQKVSLKEKMMGYEIR